MRHDSDIQHVKLFIKPNKSDLRCRCCWVCWWCRGHVRRERDVHVRCDGLLYEVLVLHSRNMAIKEGRALAVMYSSEVTVAVTLSVAVAVSVMVW